MTCGTTRRTSRTTSSTHLEEVKTKTKITVQVILTEGHRQRYTAACLAALRRRGNNERVLESATRSELEGERGMDDRRSSLPADRI